VKWIEWRKKSGWLEETDSELEVVDESAGYMAYRCAARGNREKTIAGNLVTVNFFHEQ